MRLAIGLNAAALGLHLLHQKIEMNDLSDAESTIFKIFNELKQIEDQLDGPAERKPGKPEVQVASTE